MNPLQAEVVRKEFEEEWNNNDYLAFSHPDHFIADWWLSKLSTLPTSPVSDKCPECGFSKLQATNLKDDEEFYPCSTCGMGRPVSEEKTNSILTSAIADIEGMKTNDAYSNISNQALSAAVEVLKSKMK